MRTDFLLSALVGMASASSIIPRQEDGYGTPDPATYKPAGYDAKAPAPAPPKPDYHGYKPAAHSGYDAQKGPAPEKPAYQEYKPESHGGYDSHAPAPAPEKSGYQAEPEYTPVYKAAPANGDYRAAPALPMNSYDADQYTEAAKQKGYSAQPYSSGSREAWRPKTNHPEFFSVLVDQECTGDDGTNADGTPCGTFTNYAIRLDQGNVIATPYNKFFDTRLPIFFVDDDTELYTVSKRPLQLYVDTVDGGLRYAPVGLLPPNSIAFSFYKTGDNPLGIVDGSPATLSWPSTQGNTFLGDGPWMLCSRGRTQQYEVFIADQNFNDDTSAGVSRAPCDRVTLAAVNASPWRSIAAAPY